jgi:hypothetical protein
MSFHSFVGGWKSGNLAGCRIFVLDLNIQFYRDAKKLDSNLFVKFTRIF